MKFNNTLKQLANIKPLQGLKKESRITKVNFLNEMDLILYSTNLCLFAARILRNEIKVNNSDIVLSMVNKEVYNLSNLMSKNDFILDSNYTKKETIAFFKKVGLKPKHIKTK